MAGSAGGQQHNCWERCAEPSAPLQRARVAWCSCWTHQKGVFEPASQGWRDEMGERRGSAGARAPLHSGARNDAASFLAARSRRDAALPDTPIRRRSDSMSAAAAESVVDGGDRERGQFDADVHVLEEAGRAVPSGKRRKDSGTSPTIGTDYHVGSTYLPGATQPQQIRGS